MAHRIGLALLLRHIIAASQFSTLSSRRSQIKIWRRMVRAVMNKEALESFIIAVAKRREADDNAARLFREYLVKSLAIFDTHKAAG